MPSDAINSAAPATRESNRGEHLDTLSVPAFTTWRTESGRETRAEIAARRARLRADEERRKVSRKLDALTDNPATETGTVGHSVQWERNWANELVTELGFDPEYLARRYHLARRTGER